MGQVLRKVKKDFQHRKNIGSDFESRVQELLTRKGILTTQLNAESLPEDHMRTISYLHDSTSNFVKLLPDWCCTIPHKYSFFLECKRSTIDSKFYSFALDEFNYQRQLVKTFGIKMLAVFTDWSGMLKAQWIDQITDYEVYDRSKLNGVNGSKKEFVLISKSSLPIFQQVLNEL